MGNEDSEMIMLKKSSKVEIKQKINNVISELDNARLNIKSALNILKQGYVSDGSKQYQKQKDKLVEYKKNIRHLENRLNNIINTIGK